MTTQYMVRPGRPTDAAEIAILCAALWPPANPPEFEHELRLTLSGEPITTLPLTLFVAEIPDKPLIGFVEVSLRSHADGCDPRQPTGFLEGWFVMEEYRGMGVGAPLVAAAEDWARMHGCKEMASDTWLDHTISQHAHKALGFEIVDRCVHYRKAL